jgi:hypothetical protein
MRRNTLNFSRFVAARPNASGALPAAPLCTHACGAGPPRGQPVGRQPIDVSKYSWIFSARMRASKKKL